jgi:hypothetical protein
MLEPTCGGLPASIKWYLRIDTAVDAAYGNSIACQDFQRNGLMPRRAERRVVYARKLFNSNAVKYNTNLLMPNHGDRSFDFRRCRSGKWSRPVVIVIVRGKYGLYDSHTFHLNPWINGSNESVGITHGSIDH